MSELTVRVSKTRRLGGRRTSGIGLEAAIQLAAAASLTGQGISIDGGITGA